MSSPTVRRRRLGTALRELRKAAGLTHDQVAERLMCSSAKISHMERGRYKINPRDVRDLVQIYGVADDRAAELLALAREQATETGWWQDYRDVHRRHFTTFLGLEAEASALRAYEQLIFPGLLQTADYARAVICATPGAVRDEDIERLVDARLIRQQRLAGPGALDLWLVLEEAVLHRPVGGPAVLRAQLEHLLAVGDRPNVTIQVLPTEIGAHAGLSGSFGMLDFPDPADPEVVYVDVTAGEMLLSPDEVRSYRLVFTTLCAVALSPERSRDSIEAAHQRR